MKRYPFDYSSLLHQARMASMMQLARPVMSLVAGLLTLSLAAMPQNSFAADDSSGNAAMQLASKIAAFESGRESNPQELVTAYEKVYGKVGVVPDRWPALVRRVLVCQPLHDQICVHSSVAKLKQGGGIDALALNHLFEVSRFGMRAESIREHLRTADTKDIADAPSLAKPVETPLKVKPVAEVVQQDVAPMPVKALTSTPPPVAAALAPAADPAPASAHAVASAVADPSPHKAIKVAQSKSLMQRATAKLGRLASADAAGFFLDALFIVVALTLLLSYWLYRAIRGRGEERRERLRALQEIQRLEELRDQDKVAAEHDLWSERLKAEVAIEAQKAHAEDLRRLAQQASDETILAERELASTTIKSERAHYEQLLASEKERTAEILKNEQVRAEDAVKAARQRADQAIDAYDQMAARELVYAHKHNDELQDALNGEQTQREELEMKNEEALQTIETMKSRERKLLDIIKAEQRVRISEARQAAEKLKAAQQAAVALHQSLVATRAMKVDLERRAEEAAHAAELRLMEARQQSLPASSVSTASNENTIPAHAMTAESELPPATVVLKDVFSR